MRKQKAPQGFVSKITRDGRLVFRAKYHDILIVHDDVKSELKHFVKFTNQFECIYQHLHHKNRFFWKVDLAKAFDHVTFNSVFYLKHLPEDVRCYPEIFFHENGGLIQGAPASPKIFQLFCMEKLDPKLKEFCLRNKIIFTRFADDILFSSRVSIGKSAREKIRNIIRDAGFQVNEEKVKLTDTLHAPIVYLGIKIYQGKASPEDEFMKKLAMTPPGNCKDGMLGWVKTVQTINRYAHENMLSKKKRAPLKKETP